ncbi:MAG: hypothetical protein EGR68_09745, partial [Prevotella copri]|nr:hypothetical protein [Segatella copri]
MVQVRAEGPGLGASALSGRMGQNLRNFYFIYRKREKFMKIVILDGYAANPGDLDYHLLEKLGE